MNPWELGKDLVAPSVTVPHRALHRGHAALTTNGGDVIARNGSPRRLRLSSEAHAPAAYRGALAARALLPFPLPAWSTEKRSSSCRPPGPTVRSCRSPS